MYCTQCGEKYAEGAMFCTACGNRLSMEGPAGPGPAGAISPTAEGLENLPVLVAIIFTIITLGIYYPYWFLSRRGALNKLHSDEKLSSAPFIVAIVLVFLSLVLAGAAGAYQGMGQRDVGLVFELIGRLIELAFCIIYIVQAFKVKRIFNDHYNKYLGREIPFSGVATFFFQVLYLQYKINRF